MWLGRLLIFALILTLLPLIRRIIVAFLAGLLGRPTRTTTRTGARCPRCNGSGWIAAGAGVKKACGCGAVPPEARGPIIDVGKRD